MFVLSCDDLQPPASTKPRPSLKKGTSRSAEDKTLTEPGCAPVEPSQVGLCKPPEDDFFLPEPTISQVFSTTRIPEPESKTELVASLGDIEITTDEFVEIVEMGKMYSAGTDLDAMLKLPQVRSTMVMNAVDRKIIEQECKNLSIQVTQSEIDDYLGNNPPLDQLAKLDDLERTRQLDKTYGISLSLFNVIVRYEVGKQKLIEHLLTNPSDEELWKFYQSQKSRYKFDFVRVRNVPNSQELDDVIRTKNGLVEAYYKEHEKNFHHPEKARAFLFFYGFSPNMTEDKKDEIYKKVSAFREDIVTGKKSFEEIAKEHSMHYTSTRGGDMGLVSKSKMPEAFTADLPLNELSPVKITKQGCSFIKVTKRYEAFVQPLNRGTKREIAAKLLHEEGFIPSARIIAQQIIGKMKNSSPDLEAFLVEHNLALAQSDWLTLNANQSLPGIGYAPELYQALLKLNEKSPILSKPILVRGGLFCLRLLERELPDAQQFRTDRNKILTDYKTKKRPTVLAAHLLKIKPQKNISVNHKWLNATYGEPQPKNK